MVKYSIVTKIYMPYMWREKSKILLSKCRYLSFMTRKTSLMVEGLVCVALITLRCIYCSPYRVHTFPYLSSLIIPLCHLNDCSASICVLSRSSYDHILQWWKVRCPFQEVVRHLLWTLYLTDNTNHGQQKYFCASFGFVHFVLWLWHCNSTWSL